MMKIKKAVIPVAGKGTRMLPATKAISKELFPLLTVPNIHFVVMEALKAGIQEIVFITSNGKEDILKFYSRSLELENFLEKNNKLEELELVQNIGNLIEVISVNQKEQLGLGHAILQAEKVVGSEPFAVLLGDEIIFSETSVITQLVDAAALKNPCSVVAMMKVPADQTHKYGILSGQFLNDTTMHLKQMVEKPKAEVAPSQYATPGRYIFQPEIFDYLKKIPRGVGGEFQLTDAINLMAQEKVVLGHAFAGNRFDTGHVLGYFEAMIEVALADPQLSIEARKIMTARLARG
jgi:UTP--glucose-1-phosphate uridylyltransferase